MIYNHTKACLTFVVLLKCETWVIDTWTRYGSDVHIEINLLWSSSPSENIQAKAACTPNRHSLGWARKIIMRENFHKKICTPFGRIFPSVFMNAHFIAMGWEHCKYHLKRRRVNVTFSFQKEMQNTLHVKIGNTIFLCTIFSLRGKSKTIVKSSHNFCRHLLCSCHQSS